MTIKRSALPFIVVTLVATATFALTAANSVPATNAGQGAGSIVGYSFSSTPTYTLDASNPRLITLVGFTVNAPPASATTIRAQVSPGGFVGCTLASSTATTSTWSCPLSVSVSTGATLRVAGAQ